MILTIYYFIFILTVGLGNIIPPNMNFSLIRVNSWKNPEMNVKIFTFMSVQVHVWVLILVLKFVRISKFRSVFNDETKVSVW